MHVAVKLVNWTLVGGRGRYRGVQGGTVDSAGQRQESNISGKALEGGGREGNAH